MRFILSDIKAKPKYLLPEKRVSASQAVLEPSVQNLLNDALGVIATEITKFRYKVNKGNTLTLQEARVLQGYIKSLVDLSREKRDAFDNQDLANLDNEEIAALIQRLQGPLSENKG